MISIDQVLLLQEKVESAVQKIVELKAENDALRNKCSELTNALSEKTELLNSFTADEKKIEDSILCALDRLNKIENSFFTNAGQNSTEDIKTPATPPTPIVPVVDNNLEFNLELDSDSENETEETDEKEEKFDIF